MRLHHSLLCHRGRSQARHVLRHSCAAVQLTNAAKQARRNGVYKGLDKVLAKKKKRMRWNLPDKRLLLKVCGKIKERCDVVTHLQNNWRYLGRYQNIRESAVRREKAVCRSGRAC